MYKKFDLTYIIDDDEIFAKISTRLLQVGGISDNFLVFKNGEEALDYIRPRIINSELLADLILLDINMPVMNGWEFLENIKNLPNADKLNINLISSSIDPLDFKKAKTYNLVKNFISKPFSIEKLQALSFEYNL